MSQIPPAVPPMPPGGAYGYTPPPMQRSNGAAIGSLICGILGCVPYITGLVAIILGIIGIRSTRDPQVGGKGMAIAGLVLGIVSILGWSGCLGLGGVAYISTRPARTAAKQFLTDVSTGNTQAALAESSGMTSEEIADLAKQVQPWGTLRDTTFISVNENSVNGTTTVHLMGSAVFANGPQPCFIDLVKANGSFKVTKVSFTQPTTGASPKGF